MKKSYERRKLEEAFKEIHGINPEEIQLHMNDDLIVKISKVIQTLVDLKKKLLLLTAKGDNQNK